MKVWKDADEVIKASEVPAELEVYKWLMEAKPKHEREVVIHGYANSEAKEVLRGVRDMSRREKVL